MSPRWLIGMYHEEQARVCTKAYGTMGLAFRACASVVWDAIGKVAASGHTHIVLGGEEREWSDRIADSWRFRRGR